MLAQFADARAAEAAYEHLLTRGIITRKMGSYDLPDCLRISVGLEKEMQALADALREHLGRP